MLVAVHVALRALQGTCAPVSVNPVWRDRMSCPPTMRSCDMSGRFGEARLHVVRIGCALEILQVARYARSVVKL